MHLKPLWVGFHYVLLSSHIPSCLCMPSDGSLFLWKTLNCITPRIWAQVFPSAKISFTQPNHNHLPRKSPERNFLHNTPLPSVVKHLSFLIYTKSWQTVGIWLTACFCKRFIGTSPCPCMCILSVAAFVLTAELTHRDGKAKRLTIWPFTERSAKPWSVTKH